MSVSIFFYDWFSNAFVIKLFFNAFVIKLFLNYFISSIRVIFMEINSSSEFSLQAFLSTHVTVFILFKKQSCCYTCMDPSKKRCSCDMSLEISTGYFYWNSLSLFCTSIFWIQILYIVFFLKISKSLWFLLGNWILIDIVRKK